MSNAIDRFYDEWTTVLPGPALEAKLETDASSWERLLLFPSDFASGDCTELGLERLTWIERELRVGLAIDTIRRLRDLLGLKSFLVRHNHLRTIRSQRLFKETESNISSTQQKIDRWARIYRRNYVALQKLKDGCGDGPQRQS